MIRNNNNNFDSYAMKINNFFFMASNNSNNDIESSSPASTADENPIQFPGLNDVICGRGGASNNHIGNIRFRYMVDKYQERYQATSKAEKPLIAMEIVQVWKTLEPPGRFLTKVSGNASSSSQGWAELDEQQAIKKVAQRLREKTGGSAKSSLWSSQKQKLGIKKQQPQQQKRLSKVETGTKNTMKENTERQEFNFAASYNNNYEYGFMNELEPIQFRQMPASVTINPSFRGSTAMYTTTTTPTEQTMSPSCSLFADDDCSAPPDISINHCNIFGTAATCSTTTSAAASSNEYELMDALEPIQIRQIPASVTINPSFRGSTATCATTTTPAEQTMSPPCSLFVDGDCSVPPDISCDHCNIFGTAATCSTTTSAAASNIIGGAVMSKEDIACVIPTAASLMDSVFGDDFSPLDNDVANDEDYHTMTIGDILNDAINTQTFGADLFMV